MADLKALKDLALKLGCSIEDDTENAVLYVHASNDKGWDEGTLTSLVHSYGFMGRYESKWRLIAIKDAYERLEEMGAPTPLLLNHNGKL